MRFVLASNNQKKLAEMAAILSGLGVEVVRPADLGIHIEVEETGTTFAENAMLKAKAICEASKLPAIADDSGLCVDALNGGPGVYSARYMGEDTAQEIKNNGILKELENVPEENRGAQFVSAICCVLSKEDIVECEGACHGSIGYEPLGDGGFGYDPIFMVNGRSYSQLSGEEKDAISHRGVALRKLHDILKDKFDK